MNGWAACPGCQAKQRPRDTHAPPRAPAQRPSCAGPPVTAAALDTGAAAAPLQLWRPRRQPKLNFSTRTGKGGVLTPPLEDLPKYSHVSRPAQPVGTSRAGRETNRELEAAFSAGLKARPPSRRIKSSTAWSETQPEGISFGGSRESEGKLVSRLGLEPRTPALKGQCSTIELPARQFITCGLQHRDASARTSSHASSQPCGVHRYKATSPRPFS